MMAKKSDDWLFELTNPKALQFALLSVWARYTVENREPGSERYVYDDIEWGPRLLNDVRAEWSRYVNATPKQLDDPSNFPFTISFVRKSFVATRKLNQARKVALCEAYEIPYPENDLQESEELLGVEGD